MNRQSQVLFEAPFRSEATLYINPFTNPEGETEWELPEINPYILGEEEWEQESGYPSRRQTIRETVSGFSRYSNAVPPQERVKIARIAQMIIQSYRSGQPIRTVRLVGHADRDVQRGASFERKISSNRALAVQKALTVAIKDPSIASQISWQRVSAGASRLIVQNPKTETERLRNRRVEVFFNRGQSPNQPPRPLTDADVRSDHIDVFAQKALLRLSRNPTTSTDASAMVREVKSGRLAGVYKEDRQVPALRARKMNRNWSQIVPKGKDSVLFLNPDNPKTSPIIIFRDSVRSIPQRLDPALLEAWGAYKQLRSGQVIPILPAKQCSVSTNLESSSANPTPSKGSFSLPTIAKPSRLFRTCCIFAPTIPTGSNIADPANLGRHDTATESTGIIYSGKAGFLDLGHIRDLCDLTKFVFDQIAANATLVKTLNGEATMHSCLIPSIQIEVAKAISFDSGLGHEIVSYKQPFPGGHNSSFSPEDLCSNFLGTLVAERAIQAGGNFQDEATKALNSLLSALDAQSPTETDKAFQLAIKRGWVAFSNKFSVLKDDYLRRRNFSQTPFQVGHSSDSSVPAFITTPLPSFSSIYTYVHKEGGRNSKRGEFRRLIDEIETDAKAKYGPNFNRP